MDQERRGGEKGEREGSSQASHTVHTRVDGMVGGRQLLLRKLRGKGILFVPMMCQYPQEGCTHPARPGQGGVADYHRGESQPIA